MARQWEGLLATEGVPTGDGRLLDPKAVEWGEGPWPLRFSPQGDHASAFVIGAATEVWRSGSDIWGRGSLHDDSRDDNVRTAVNRVIELASSGLAGLSVGLDDESVELRLKADLVKIYDSWEQAEADWRDEEDRVRKEKEAAGKPGGSGRVVVGAWKSDDMLYAITSGRLREITVTDQPAIVGTKVSVAPVAASGFLTTPGALLGLAPVAASGGRRDASAFANPNFGPDGHKDPRLVWQKPTRPGEVGHWGCPFTVTDDGRVYGHLATRSRCHSAYEACLLMPDSDGDFSSFLTGEAVPGVPTGPIIMDTTHGVNEDLTIKSHDHLAHTGLAVADVTVGLDQHGTWVAGRVRPGVPPEKIEALRGSALSGEWHPVGSRLRLVGILAVNSPGYLIERRTAVAASGRPKNVVATLSPGCGCETDIAGVTSRLAVALKKVRA